MHIFHSILLISITAALAAPSWPSRRSLDDIVESRDLEYSDHLEHREFRFDDLELIMRDFIEFSEILQARAGPFMKASSGTKNAAKDFLNTASPAQIQNAASGGSSAVTVHENNAFHLDRQQPSSSRFKSKVAVQLNQVKKNEPSTVGQVVIPHGVNPKPGHVKSELKKSIDHGKERTIQEAKKAKNIRIHNEKKVTKADRIAAKVKAGNERADQGKFKKGNGKKSATFTPLLPKKKTA